MTVNSLQVVESRQKIIFDWQNAAPPFLPPGVRQSRGVRSGVKSSSTAVSGQKQATPACLRGPKSIMIGSMMQVRISDLEIAGNFAAALAKVRQGMEVIVEHKRQPVAVLKAMEPEARTISEMLALIPKDSTGVMGGEFALDVEAVIEAHREPLDTSRWD